MLDDNQVHLWYTDPNRVSASLLPAYRHVLSVDELDRLERFFFEEDRRLFLVSHCLVRIVLARYLDADPSALQFTTVGLGRPELAGFDETPPLRFNLSHTRGLAVLAVAKQYDVGVDVEKIKDSTNLEIAERNFSDAENRFLQCASGEEQRRLFFRFWTLKEAYLKARALGIGFPLRTFTFHLQANQSPRITFSESVDDQPEHWRFFEREPQPDYPTAVAVRCPANQQVSLTTQSIIPLHDDGDTS